jgi:hypothetical protein
MTKYACGHESKIIFLDDCPTCFATYLAWKDSVGFNGNKTLCFDCYCKYKKRITAVQG